MYDPNLLEDADRRARNYVSNVDNQRVFPGPEALANLSRFDEPLPRHGVAASDTLQLLDDIGSPGTVISNGPNYFGFVIGATMPAAAAAERMVLAWDQCASSFTNSPVADIIEKTAAKWVLEVLSLPPESAVSFGTSASAGTLACLIAARRHLLMRQGWDVDAKGVSGAPEVRVIVSETTHVTVRKALRIMGFGSDQLVIAPTDHQGRIEIQKLPGIDRSTILCLQAGEVNTGSFDQFEKLIPQAREAGAWVHVDGAFGLWASASSDHRHLTRGVEQADSWTTDGHKWLNTPYDGAIAICRNADLLAGAMNSDAVYAKSSASSQKNLGIEFSRRARGIPIWAALRSLGSEGVGALVSKHCSLARELGDGLEEAGFTILNDVVLNQVLFRSDSDEETQAVHALAIETGNIWFGQTVWDGRAALRMSISSWYTEPQHIERAIATLRMARAEAKAEK